MTLIVPCSACLARDMACAVCRGSGIERDELELPFEAAEADFKAAADASVNVQERK